MRPIDKLKLIRSLLDQLRESLSGGDTDMRRISKAMRYMTPPLLPSVVYKGVDLNDIALPVQRGTDDQVSELFSQLVYKRLAPELLEGEVNWKPFGRTVEHFIGTNLARCLLWASRRPGFKLVHEGNTFMVEGPTRFGVRDGEVVCVYAEWLKVRTLEVEDLTQSSRSISRDRSFNLLYGRASEIDRQFLAAVRVGYPYPFDALAPWLAVGGVKHELSKKITDTLLDSADPFGDLFRLLVPTIMTKRTFYRKLGEPSRWYADPPQHVRERVFLTLSEVGIV